MRWQVGVTTVPMRRATLLPQTLSSLRAAGFPSPRLFVDGDGDTAGWQTEFGCDATCRATPVLLVANWVMGLFELYFRDPHADRYAMFQDDVICLRNLREYLDACEYPDRGYLNLYTAPSNRLFLQDETGWHPSNQRGKGACALVFSRDAVQTFFAHFYDHVITRPLDSPEFGWRRLDGAICETFLKAGWREYVHGPGLVKHVGVQPSFNKAAWATAENARELLPNWRHQAAFEGWWPGDQFDAMQFARSTI